MKITIKPKFNVGQEIKFRPGADFLDLSDHHESFTINKIIPVPCGCGYNLIDIGLITKNAHALHICSDCKVQVLEGTHTIWIHEKFLQPIDEEVLDTYEDPAINDIINKFFL